MPLGKLMCWVCMAFFVFVLVLLTLEDDTRQALLVTPLWFIALGLGWLFIQADVLGMYGVLCVCSGVVDTGR